MGDGGERCVKVGNSKKRGQLRQKNPARRLGQSLECDTILSRKDVNQKIDSENAIGDGSALISHQREEGITKKKVTKREGNT